MRQASAYGEASHRALRTHLLPLLSMQDGRAGSTKPDAISSPMLFPRDSSRKGCVRDERPGKTALHISSRRECSASRRPVVLSTHDLRPVDISQAYQEELQDAEVSSLSSGNLY